MEFVPFKKVANKEKGVTNGTDFYSKMMNEDILDLMADSRSSLVLGMKNIMKAKKLILKKNAL